MGELCLSFQGFQFSKFRHPPFLAAFAAEEDISAGIHVILLAAVRALVEDFMKAFRSFWIFGESSGGFLPGEIVILEGFYYAIVYLIYGKLLYLVRLKQQRIVCFRVDFAVVEVPERRIYVMSVGDEGYYRNLEHLA